MSNQAEKESSGFQKFVGKIVELAEGLVKTADAHEVEVDFNKPVDADFNPEEVLAEIEKEIILAENNQGAVQNPASITSNKNVSGELSDGGTALGMVQVRHNESTVSSEHINNSLNNYEFSEPHKVEHYKASTLISTATVAKTADVFVAPAPVVVAAPAPVVVPPAPAAAAIPDDAIDLNIADVNLFDDEVVIEPVAVVEPALLVPEEDEIVALDDDAEDEIVALENDAENVNDDIVALENEDADPAPNNSEDDISVDEVADVGDYLLGDNAENPFEQGSDEPALDAQNEDRAPDQEPVVPLQNDEAPVGNVVEPNIAGQNEEQSENAGGGFFSNLVQAPVYLGQGVLNALNWAFGSQPEQQVEASVPVDGNEPNIVALQDDVVDPVDGDEPNIVALQDDLVDPVDGDEPNIVALQDDVVDPVDGDEPNIVALQDNEADENEAPVAAELHDNAADLNIAAQNEGQNENAGGGFFNNLVQAPVVLGQGVLNALNWAFGSQPEQQVEASVPVDGNEPNIVALQDDVVDPVDGDEPNIVALQDDVAEPVEGNEPNIVALQDDVVDPVEGDEPNIVAVALQDNEADENEAPVAPELHDNAADLNIGVQNEGQSESAGGGFFSNLIQAPVALGQGLINVLSWPFSGQPVEQVEASTPVADEEPVIFGPDNESVHVQESPAAVVEVEHEVVALEDDNADVQVPPAAVVEVEHEVVALEDDNADVHEPLAAVVEVEHEVVALEDNNADVQEPPAAVVEVEDEIVALEDENADVQEPIAEENIAPNSNPIPEDMGEVIPDIAPASTIGSLWNAFADAWDAINPATLAHNIVQGHAPEATHAEAEGNEGSIVGLSDDETPADEFSEEDLHQADAVGTFLVDGEPDPFHSNADPLQDGDNDGIVPLSDSDDETPADEFSEEDLNEVEALGEFLIGGEANPFHSDAGPLLVDDNIEFPIIALESDESNSEQGQNVSLSAAPESVINALDVLPGNDQIMFDHPADSDSEGEIVPLSSDSEGGLGDAPPPSLMPAHHDEAAAGDGALM